MPVTQPVMDNPNPLTLFCRKEDIMFAKRKPTNFYYYIISLTVLTLLLMPSSALLAKTLKIGHILAPTSNQNQAGLQALCRKGHRRLA